MGRLIDAAEFMETVLTMKRLNEECPLSDIDLENEEINNYETGQRETFELIIEHLGKQPTAYDPDKVVEQLEKLKKAEQDRQDDYDEDGCGDGEQIYDDGRSQGRFEAFGKAIEILKGGGVDD